MKLEIVRTSVNSNSITGDLYVDDLWCCHTLERIYVENKSNISSVPEGVYGALLRYDHGDRWRFELTDTGTRKNIQIHIGNYPKNTQGCILVGMEVDALHNMVSKSLVAYLKLKQSFYGSENPDSTPHIEVVVHVMSQALKTQLDDERSLEHRLFDNASIK